MSAEERQPWPLMYRDETGKPASEFSGLPSYLGYLDSCGEGAWRCHELDRSDAEGRPRFPASVSNIGTLAAETIDRFGYDYARSFVAAVLRDDPLDEDHASLMANVGRRFGRRGLLCFAGLLAVHYTADEQWRRRSK